MRLAAAVDAADVRQAASGDRAACGRLIDRTRGLVCSIALAVVRDIATSEEVAQEVYLAVWQALPRLRNPHSFLPWLRQLTRNRAHDALRRAAPRSLALSEELLERIADPRPDAGSALAAAETEQALQAAFDELPDESREVIALFYREGRSAGQLALLLGLSEPAVRKRLQRARELLREETLSRLGELLEQTAPSAALTATVLGALTNAAPATANAAVVAQAVKAGVAAKLTVGLAGAGLGGLLGALGVLFGARRIARYARDDEERAALRRFGYVNAGLTLGFATALWLGFSICGGVGLGSAFAVFYLAFVHNYFVWLPRITAEREAATRACDLVAWRQQRRARRLEQLNLILGGLIGGATVLWAILQLSAPR